MAFRYEALDAGGRPVSAAIDAGSQREAAELLRSRGLFVTRIETADESAKDLPGTHGGRKHSRVKLRDVLMFTQQMSMLLRAGARVVQALEAIESQCERPALEKLLRTIRIEVEQGKPMSLALNQFPDLFPGALTSMIAAGEASGDIALSFQRLSSLLRQQLEIRTRVIGALTYPAVLTTMCVGVVIVLFSFVLPRFAEMFEVLQVELPATTAIMIAASFWIRSHWFYVVGACLSAGFAGYVCLRSPTGTRVVSRLIVRVPLFGQIVRNVILARVCRVWGHLLESKVGLLEAVKLTVQSTSSLDFQELLNDIAQAITDGSSIGPPLRKSWLLSKTFAAAIVTGEDSGKLDHSLLFVAACLEEENNQVLASLTRIIEPIMLVVMGLIVGTVAISLFMPLFDLSTIAGK